MKLLSFCLVVSFALGLSIVHCSIKPTKCLTKTKTIYYENSGIHLPSNPTILAISPAPSKPTTPEIPQEQKNKMPSTHGWIWPKDPRPGNPSHWPRRWRLFDILRNRGPDIFVGRIRSTKDKSKNRDNKREVELAAPIQQRPPQRRDCSWARWDDVHPTSTNIDNTGSGDEGSRQTKYVYTSAFPWTTRRPNERYDFRTKRYAVPDSGTWSRVEYCSGDLEGHGRGWTGRGKRHVIPVRYWDKNGEMYPAGYWHDVVYGGHAGCCDSGLS